MELRTILFGYKKEQFSYFIETNEAKLVKEVFSRYISGETLLQIANDFTSRQVVYYKNKTTWTKNAIRRVLENEHYCGDIDYPAIITKEQFEKANSTRISKGGTWEKDTDLVIWLKEHSYCEQCGNKFSRRNHWSKNREKWGYGCGCAYDVYIDDQFYFDKIKKVINKTIGNPELLITEKRGRVFEPTLQMLRTEKEINRMLEQTNPKFGLIKTAIYQSISDKYSAMEMDTSGEFTDNLVHFFKGEEILQVLKPEILRKTVKKISVKKNGEILVEFINSAIVESEENINGRTEGSTVTKSDN